MRTFASCSPATATRRLWLSGPHALAAQRSRPDQAHEAGAEALDRRRQRIGAGGDRQAARRARTALLALPHPTPGCSRCAAGTTGRARGETCEGARSWSCRSETQETARGSFQAHAIAYFGCPGPGNPRRSARQRCSGTGARRRRVDPGHVPLVRWRQAARGRAAAEESSRGTKTPVILSIGPYFNHSGQTGPAGPVEGTSYDPVGPSEGPSDRFFDFVEGAKLMERGYTFVMVDLRGFGGSSGCLDWAGPGEQSDVVNAVKWAASQSWSTGKVGMYGKSYDGVTGLIGANRQPARPRGGRLAGAGLRPLPLPVRRRHPPPQLGAHARAVRPDRPDARPGARRPELQHRRAERHAAARLPGAEPGRPGRQRRPLLGLLAPAQPDPRGQGLDGAAVPDPGPHREQHRGRRHRAVPRQPRRIRARMARPVGARPRQRARRERPPQDGPRGLLRRGHALLRPVPEGHRPRPCRTRPSRSQTNDGKWRAEQSWPPADATGYTSALRTGSYTDDGSGSATETSDTEGVWTISPRP